MSQAKYFNLLKQLPRVTLTNMKDNPYSSQRSQKKLRRKKKGIKCPYVCIKHAIGSFEDNPFVSYIPKYGFNRDREFKRQYLPLSLWQLQNMVDVGQIDPSMPIDLNTIANTRRSQLDKAHETCYGVYLVEQGANIFKAKVNLEVQVADELSIAMIEKFGGNITTTFYDRRSFEILCDPVSFFLRGKPIPKRLLPPEDLLPYYTDPKVRGYLSDPVEVAEQRKELANKYGYELIDNSINKELEINQMKKDPRQIFFGVEPGSIVNLEDEVVINADSEYLQEYFSM